MGSLGSDSVRLPNGSVTTVNRARARGWIDADGNLTAAAPQPSRAEAERQKAIRAQEWRRRQGIAPAQDEDTPEEKAALQGRKAKRIEPLKPKNVDHDGTEITDKATLDDIAAKTAAIEKAEAVSRG